MGLLAPLFLLGLAAVAVPVIIHLRLRHRSQVVAFPSLMFISRAPYRSVRRRRLRDLLLLALRCLALALLALAFARPLFRGDSAANAAAANRLSVVLLDNSFSMGFGGRWQRAVDAAASTFEGMGAQDRAALIVYSDQAEMVSTPTSDRSLLLSLARGTELVPRATSLLPAIQVARGVLADAGTTAVRELVIVSDFQRSSWAPDNAALLPQGVELRLVDVRSDEEAVGNAAVTDVLLDHSRVSSSEGGADDREQVGIAARISYQGLGAAAAEDGAASALRAEVDLLFDGEVIQTRAADLTLDSSTMVSFAPEVLERERTTRGAVRLREDALDIDNEFHFVLSPAHEVGVLVIEPDGDRRRSRYLQEALSLGRRPFLRVNRVQVSGFEPTMLEGKSVVVINDAAQQLPSGAAAAVQRFVREGGGLLLGVERGLTSTSALLGELGVGSPQQVDRLSGTPGSLAWFDTGHPVFDIFAAARNGDFSSASFFRYHRLEIPDGAAAVALFDDGSPALLDLMPLAADDSAADSDVPERGRVLVFPTSLDTFWNTLPVQAVFLPFVHRSMDYLAGYSLARSWYRVGEVASVELPRSGLDDADDGYVAVAPSGGERRVGGDGRDLLLDVEEPGFYEFREVRADVASERLTLAANVPVSESDLGALDLDEFMSRIRPVQTDEEEAALATATTPEERERRQRLWWYLIAAAAAVLAAEGLFGNRRPATAAPIVTAWGPTGEET